MKFTYASGARPLDGYTIKRGVGQGGFGEVYYAVSDGGKEVALKLVQRNLDVELRGVAQCLNLKHPNLVTLYDLRTNDLGEHFVIMEYVSGRSLAQILDENPQGLPIDEANRWLRGITAGVGYLHDKGIVHRDLKPGNLFLEDGVVKVGDYGLSKFITASRRSGQTESVGTVHYMAPEISRGRYDREIDIYATGIILYEMLTGDVPFDGESVGEILMKHLTAEPDVSKLAPPYDALVSRALAKEPTARFRTMEQMASSLNGRLAEPHAGKLGDTIAYLHPAPGPVNAGSEPAVAPRPLRAAATSGASRSGDWFHRTRESLSAWWNRPWAFRDYVLAFPLGLLVAVLALGAGTVGLAVLPWALMGIGVLWLIRKVAGKDAPRAAVVATAAAPIQLDPSPTAHAPPPPSTPEPHATPIMTAPPVPVVAEPARPPVRLLRPLRQIAPLPELPPKLARTRIAEATSAMLLTAVLSVIAAVLASGPMQLHQQKEWALLAGTCLAGCWAVIVPAKLWEGRKGDPVLRRLVMCVLGLGVGAWSYYLDEVLQVGLFTGRTVEPALFEAPKWLPMMLTSASYVGLVFLASSWWTLADARRGVRFNPWLAAWPSLMAYAVSWIWSYPQPWGVVVAGMIAVLVQLASPWDDVASRRRLVA